MKLLLLLGTALVLALTACGGSHRSTQPVLPVLDVRVPSVHALAAARRREAGRKAERLLRRVALPSGAVRLPRLPAGSRHILGRSQLGLSLLTEIADRHAFWSVRLPLSSVDSFVKTHPPAGLKGGTSASSSGPGVAPNETEDFSGRSEGGRPVQRFMSIAMARVGGRTVIRVDAGAAWVYPRSPSEVVPEGVRQVDISGGGVSRRVVEPAKVRRILGWFDALNIVQPGQAAVACPLSLASKVTFSFRSASKAELATALVPSQPATGCNPIQFFIGKKSQTPLIDSTPGGGRAFIRRVERLLGVRFSSRR